MTFSEKIDKLLKTSKLVNSVNGLEKAIKASNGSIQKHLNEGKEPGNKVMKKIQDFFGEQWHTIEKNQEEKTIAQALVEISSTYQSFLNSFREDKNSEIQRMDGQLKGKDDLILSLQDEKKDLRDLLRELGSKLRSS